jgi:hypothetical protein
MSMPTLYRFSSFSVDPTPTLAILWDSASFLAFNLLAWLSLTLKFGTKFGFMRRRGDFDSSFVITMLWFRRGSRLGLESPNFCLSERPVWILMLG